MVTAIEIELAIDTLADDIYPIPKRIKDIYVVLEMLSDARAKNNTSVTLEKAKFLAKAAKWLERAIREEQRCQAILLDSL